MHPQRSWPYLLVALLFLATWLGCAVPVAAMRPDRIAELRHETVDMFYHGYDSYMQLAFPEDEVCLLQCGCRQTKQTRMLANELVRLVCALPR